MSVQFLNPDDPVSSLDDHLALFGRDIYQIYIADAVIFDLRERRGIGIGVELMAACHFGKRCIGVAPRNTYYRQDALEYRGGVARDYLHPHLAALLDFLTEDFVSAGEHLLAPWPHSGILHKNELLEQSMNAYRARLLPFDGPMKELLLKSNQ